MHSSSFGRGWTTCSGLVSPLNAQRQIYTQTTNVTWQEVNLLSITVRKDSANKYVFSNSKNTSLSNTSEVSLVVPQSLSVGKPWLATVGLLSYTFVYVCVSLSTLHLWQLVLIEEMIWTLLPHGCAGRTFGNDRAAWPSLKVWFPLLKTLI